MKKGTAPWGCIDVFYKTKSSNDEKMKLFGGTYAEERKMLRFIKQVVDKGGVVTDVHYD